MDSEGQPRVCLKGKDEEKRQSEEKETSIQGQGARSAEDQMNTSPLQVQMLEEEDDQTEAINNQIKKLSIAEQESRRIVAIEDDDIEEKNKDLNDALACKILTTKLIHWEIFANIMPRIWGVEGKINIEKEGRNTFLCKFKYIRDKTRIYRGSPWIFDDALVLFEDPKGETNINKLEFRYAPFWIHFHGLPPVCFCRKYAEALGNAIGEFEEVLTDGNGKISGENLRIRIRVDTKEPIKRGTNIKVGSKADKTWIPITYEKLPDFCYKCGRLGHVKQDCEEEEAEAIEEGTFGINLRETQGSKGYYRPIQLNQWNERGKTQWERGRGRHLRNRGRGHDSFWSEHRRVKANGERWKNGEDKEPAREANEEVAGGPPPMRILRKNGETSSRHTPQEITIPTDSSVTVDKKEDRKVRTIEEGQYVKQTEKEEVVKNDGHNKNSGNSMSETVKGKGKAPMSATNENYESQWAMGPIKEMERAMDVDLEERNEDQKLNQRNLFGSKGNIRSGKKWKRKARMGPQKETKEIRMMREKRKCEEGELEEGISRKKQITTDFGSIEGISAEAGYQPRRMP